MIGLIESMKVTPHPFETVQLKDISAVPGSAGGSLSTIQIAPSEMTLSDSRLLRWCEIQNMRKQSWF